MFEQVQYGNFWMTLTLVQAYYSTKQDHHEELWGKLIKFFVTLVWIFYLLLFLWFYLKQKKIGIKLVWATSYVQINYVACFVSLC